MGVIFMAANPSLWRHFRPFLILILWISCSALVVGMLQMHGVSRAQAYRWLHEPSLILEITAFLPLGVYTIQRPKFAKLKYVPILILLLSAILMQQRQMLLILFIGGVLFVWIRRLREPIMSGAMFRRVIFALIAATALATCIAILSVIPQEWLIFKSYESLQERIFEDSRSYQFVNYFEEMDLETFLLGKGHLIAQQSFGGGGIMGIDSAYLNILWIGGLPLLCLFIAFAVVPVIRCIFMRLSTDDAAVVSCAFVYCVRLLSSTHPGFMVQFMVACILFGRCIYLVKQSRLRG
jgi:hypothetical protein